MIFCGYFGPNYYVSMTKRGTHCNALKLRGAHFEGSTIPRGALWRLYNSAGHTLKALQFRGAHFKGSKFLPGKDWCKFTPQSFRASDVPRTELWSLWSASRGVLEQCNVCPAFSWRHSYGGQGAHKNHLKLRFSLFFKVIFLIQCHFRYLYNKYDPFY